jgi:cytosine deaminase
MTANFRLPANTMRWTITDARVPACLLESPIGTPDREGLVTADITVADRRIEAITAAAAANRPEPVLHRPGLVLPCFIDAHTHIDKGHIWPRAPNPDGSVMGARNTVPVDRAAHWTADDVRTRMEFSLRAAYAHGTRALRTHIDSYSTQTRISWPVLAEVRERWAGRVDVQASPLFGIDLALDDAHMLDVTDMVAEFGHCLGAVTYPGPALRPGLERLFRLASDKGFELDFHADETNNPEVNSLALIAEMAIEFGFPQKILAGHCCTLSLMATDERQRTIDLVARAGLSIVSLPMCNMYLQDRDDPARTPRWRGVPAIKELRAAGVDVMIASDNTRDSFYAHGDLDMVEVWREGTRIAHLDHPYGSWAETVARNPAKALSLAEPGVLRAGSPADFIVFSARSLSELMARPYMDRIVIRDGQPIDAAPPSYSELDHLAGLAL